MMHDFRSSNVFDKYHLIDTKHKLSRFCRFLLCSLFSSTLAHFLCLLKEINEGDMPGTGGGGGFGKSSHIYLLIYRPRPKMNFE